MSALALIITSRAAAGKRDEVFALYEELLAPRAEADDDQQVVVWVDDQQDPDTFHLFELYADAAAFGRNAEAEWFADYMDRAGPLLAAEPQVTMGRPRWSTGL